MSVPTRIDREEIALRLLCAALQSGKPVGPEEVNQAFALAITFEERSEKLGMRPHRERSHTRSRLAFDDDGE